MTEIYFGGRCSRKKEKGWTPRPLAPPHPRTPSPSCNHITGRRSAAGASCGELKEEKRGMSGRRVRERRGKVCFERRRSTASTCGPSAPGRWLGRWLGRFEALCNQGSGDAQINSKAHTHTHTAGGLQMVCVACALKGNEIVRSATAPTALPRCTGKNVQWKS